MANDDLAAWENAYGAQSSVPSLAALSHPSLALFVEGRENAVAGDRTALAEERAVSSSTTAPVLSAQLVDLAIAANEMKAEGGGRKAELLQEERLSESLPLAVSELDEAPRLAAGDFGDIAVSRPDDGDFSEIELSLDDELVFSLL
jgi:hypothetical protein